MVSPRLPGKLAGQYWDSVDTRLDRGRMPPRAQHPDMRPDRSQSAAQQLPVRRLALGACTSALCWLGHQLQRVPVTLCGGQLYAQVSAWRDFGCGSPDAGVVKQGGQVRGAPRSVANIRILLQLGDCVQEGCPPHAYILHVQ